MGGYLCSLHIRSIAVLTTYGAIGLALLVMIGLIIASAPIVRAARRRRRHW